MAEKWKEKSCKCSIVTDSTQRENQRETPLKRIKQRSSKNSHYSCRLFKSKMVEPSIALPILIFVSSLFSCAPCFVPVWIWPIFDFYDVIRFDQRVEFWPFSPPIIDKLTNKPQFRCMYSEVLLLIALVITSIVIYDWSNCDKIESACFYALSIPGLGVQLLVYFSSDKSFFRCWHPIWSYYSSLSRYAIDWVDRSSIVSI